MSTKIHNGYRLPKFSTNEIFSFADLFRAKIKEQFIKEYYIIYTSFLSSLIDCYDLKMKIPIEFEEENIKISEGSNKFSFSFITNRLVDTKIEKAATSLLKNYVWDFSCRLTLLPSPRNIYALLYSQRQSAAQILSKLPGVEYYPYWNNTDPPENVTREQWKRIGKQWDKAIGDNRPIDCGISIEYAFEDTYTFDKEKRNEQIKQHMPTLEHRINLVAKHNVSQEYFKNNPIDSDTSDEKDVSSIWGRYRIYEKWIKTDEGIKSLEQERDRLKPLLRPTIEEKDYQEQIVASLY